MSISVTDMHPKDADFTMHNCKQTAHTEYRLFISQLPTSTAAVSPPLGANLMTMYWSKQCFTNLLSAPPSSTKSLCTNSMAYGAVKLGCPATLQICT